jgi:hypothetical protein
MSVDVRRRSGSVDGGPVGPDRPVTVDIRSDLGLAKPADPADPSRVRLDEISRSSRSPIAIPIMPDDEIVRWFG